MNKYVNMSGEQKVKSDSGEQTKYIVRTVYSIMCGVDSVWICTVRQCSMYSV